jgi:SAM-dependent methyltransferase
MKGRFVKAIVIAAVSATVSSCLYPDFVPTPMIVVDRMLELAKVTEKDVVYDLGSGDGRIVIAAAKKYGANGVGIEYDPTLVELAKVKAAEAGVANLVTFELRDLLKANIRPATVITLFLDIKFNVLLRPVLEEQLQPGTRIVSYTHAIPGWEPEVSQNQPLSPHAGKLIHVEETPNGDKIYVWKMD